MVRPSGAKRTQDPEAGPSKRPTRNCRPSTRLEGFVCTVHQNIEDFLQAGTSRDTLPRPPGIIASAPPPRTVELLRKRGRMLDVEGVGREEFWPICAIMPTVAERDGWLRVVWSHKRPFIRDYETAYGHDLVWEIPRENILPCELLQAYDPVALADLTDQENYTAQLATYELIIGREYETFHDNWTGKSSTQQGTDLITGDLALQSIAQYPAGEHFKVLMEKWDDWTGRGYVNRFGAFHAPELTLIFWSHVAKIWGELSSPVKFYPRIYGRTTYHASCFDPIKKKAWELDPGVKEHTPLGLENTRKEIQHLGVDGHVVLFLCGQVVGNRKSLQNRHLFVGILNGSSRDRWMRVYDAFQSDSDTAIPHLMRNLRDELDIGHPIEISNGSQEFGQTCAIRSMAMIARLLDQAPIEELLSFRLLDGRNN